MAEIRAMREKMARLATNARSLLEEIQDSTPEDVAADKERQHDEMMSEFDSLQSRVEKLTKAEERLKALEEPMDITKRPSFEERSAPAAEDPKIDYRQAFYKYLAGGEALLGAEDRAVLEQRIQTEYVGNDAAAKGAAGGYTVPETLSETIEAAMKYHGPMWSDSSFTTLNSPDGTVIKFPTIDDTASVWESHTEAAAITDDGGKDVTFGEKSLTAYSRDSEWIKWSAEMDMDSFLSMESFLGQIIGERLGRTANSELTTGNGTSAPQGIVTGSTAGKTAAATAAITADETIDLVHSVDVAYRRGNRVAFMMNDLTLAAIRKLKDSDNNYIWQMGNIINGVPPTLHGYPILVNNDMDTLASAKKVVLFGDMSKFIVRKVGAPKIFVAREKYAPDIGILGYTRYDSLLIQPAAIKHLVTA